MKPQRASRGVVWLVIFGFLDFITLFLIHIMIAKLLGSREYGLFGLLSSILLWVRTFISTGILTSLSKYLSDARYSKQDVIQKSFRVQIITSLLFSVLIFGAAFPLAWFLKEQILASCFMIFALHTFFYSFLSYANTCQITLKLYRESVWNAFLHSLFRIVCVWLGIRLGMQLIGVCWAHVIAVVGALVFLSIFMRRLFRFDDLQEGLSLDYREFLHVSGFQMGFTLLLNLFFVVNLVIPQRLIGDAVSIGYYVAANTISRAPNQIIIRALLTVSLPIAAAAFSKQNGSLGLHYVRQAFKFFLVFFIPFGVAIAVTGRALLGLVFTSEFAVIYPALNLYYWGVMGLSGIHLATYFLYARGKVKYPFYFMLLLTALQIVLVYLFVPMMGISGAALAFCLTGGLGFFVFMRQFVKDIQFSFPFFLAGRILAAAMVFGLLVLWIPGNGIFLLFRYLLAGAVYTALLFILNVITRDDLVSFLGPKVEDANA